MIASRLTLIAAIILTCVANTNGFAQTDKVATQGVATEKPTEGRFVDLGDGKFMVPYTATIPGTEIEFNMEPIPGGEFVMGNADGEDDQQPTFKVRIEPFWMAKCEITWAEYKRYMQMEKAIKLIQAEGERVVSEENEVDAITCPSALYDPSFTYNEGQEPEQAAATITQYAAKQYTKWLSLSDGQFYRLPYESEWEYACRAATDTKFYFGDDDDDLEDHAWFENNADVERHSVGELKANPWGLHDMYGNVAEWTLDQYSEEGYVQAAGKEDAVLSTKEAYNKPTKLFPRAIRGGSFLNDSEFCNSYARIASHSTEWRDSDPNFPKSPWWFTDEPATGVGFRIVRQYTAATQEEKLAVWDADLASIARDAKSRIEDNGRGAYGTVDKNLDDQVAELDEGELSLDE